MGTMCVIAAKCKDGYRAISVHFDGYLEGAGALLVRNYNTEAKVNKLIDLGDLSSLGPTIGHQFDNNDDVMHSALSNIQCIAYHRDEGHRRKVAEYKIVQSAIKKFDAQPVKDEATLIAEAIDYFARVHGGIAATMIEEQFKQHENKLNKQSILVMYDDLQQYIADRINSLKED